jgi:hypothetical protein
MTTCHIPTCERPAPDATICRTHHAKTRAAWITHHPTRNHPHAHHLWDEITAIVGHLTRTIDNPQPRTYAGPCTCGTDLYHRPGALTIACTCGIEHTTAEPPPTGVRWMEEPTRATMRQP